MKLTSEQVKTIIAYARHQGCDKVACRDCALHGALHDTYYFHCVVDKKLTMVLDNDPRQTKEFWCNYIAKHKKVFTEEAVAEALL